MFHQQDGTSAKLVLLPGTSRLQGFGAGFYKNLLHPKVVCEYSPPLKQVLQMIITFTKNVKLVLTELLLSVILRIPCRHQPLKIQAMLYSSSFLTSIFKGCLEYVDEDYFGSWQKFCRQFYLKFYCFIKGWEARHFFISQSTCIH